MSMAQSFVVPARFCGPPDSGNGGYTCGMLAREVGGTLECTLRRPVPLEVPLQIERRNSGAVLLREGEIIIEAMPTEISLEAPEPIGLEAAKAAMAASPALDARHPFPACFVCGPQRPARDGLRIFPGPAEGTRLCAAEWSPAAEFGDAQKFLKPELLWAALDCPTGFAAGFRVVGKLVTGRLAVEQRQPVRVGVECLLLSWPLGVEGRKHFSAACLYQHQKLCAVARATWIKLETPRSETPS